jgi:hypothetical protein
VVSQAHAGAQSASQAHPAWQVASRSHSQLSSGPQVPWLHVHGAWHVDPTSQGQPSVPGGQASGSGDEEQPIRIASPTRMGATK